MNKNLAQHPDRDDLRADFLARLEFGLNPLVPWDVDAEEGDRG